MASPIWEGTYTSSAFSSRDIDILKEKMHITIDKDFKTASYVIEYYIKTEADGKQIPLLFHAKDYNGDFNVWVDNQEVKLHHIPSEYLKTSNSPFEKFSNSFSPPTTEGGQEIVAIYWEKNLGFVYALNDLKYFEANLTRGKHKVRVEYIANVWTDISGWVKEYSFRYSLSPAKYWKSFGSLEIILDASSFNTALTTNIGHPINGELDSVAVWNFNELPTEYFEINYTPQIGSFAKTMIAISPIGLTFVITLLLASLHFLCIVKFRKSRSINQYSWVVMVGSIINSILILIGYMISYYLIDSAIGAEAGNHHGYIFLVVVLYPILLPIYWLLMWLVDIIVKRRINNAL